MGMRVKFKEWDMLTVEACVVGSFYYFTMCWLNKTRIGHMFAWRFSAYLQPMREIAGAQINFNLPDHLGVFVCGPT